MDAWRCTTSRFPNKGDGIPFPKGNSVKHGCYKLYDESATPKERAKKKDRLKWLKGQTEDRAEAAQHRETS